RDLKPDNILIHSDGREVLSDFGIARAVSSYVASTGVNMTIGTPQYLSPEQAQGRPLDERVDFYALGVTLFKAATGEVPFTSTDWFELARMHVEAAPPSLRKKRPVLSKRFERVVMKCLAKHPDDRYRDATQLLAGASQLRFVWLGKRALGETDGEAGTALNGPELDDPRRCAVDHVDQGLQRFPVAVCRIPVIRRGYGDHKPLRLHAARHVALERVLNGGGHEADRSRSPAA